MNQRQKWSKGRNGRKRGFTLPSADILSSSRPSLAPKRSKLCDLIGESSSQIQVTKDPDPTFTGTNLVKEVYKDLLEKLHNTTKSFGWRRTFLINAGRKPGLRGSADEEGANAAKEDGSGNQIMLQPQKKRQNTDNSQPTIIPYVKTLPTMTYWIPTDTSRWCEDSKFLTHIPYLGEDGSKLCQQEEKFNEELLSMYDGKLHSEDSRDYTDHGTETELDPVVLPDLIRVLRKVEKVCGVAVFTETARNCAKSPTKSKLEILEELVLDNKEEAFIADPGPGPSTKLLRCVGKAFNLEDKPHELRTRMSPENSINRRSSRLRSTTEDNKRVLNMGTPVVGPMFNCHESAAIASLLRKSTQEAKEDHEALMAQRAKAIPESSFNEDHIQPNPYLASLFKPCNHDGLEKCNKECSCKQNGQFCEASCGCLVDSCKNRFKGCQCTTTCENRRCPCLAASRECEVGVCKRCCSHNKNNQGITCKNYSVQRGLGKKLKLRESSLSGWGIYSDCCISKGEFIIEYVGECISHDEAERRGLYYDLINHTFLFKLDDELSIDAGKLGNGSRFINSSKRPNCLSRIMTVRGDKRICIYAIKNILPNEELTLNYNEVIKYGKGPKTYTQRVRK